MTIDRTQRLIMIATLAVVICHFSLIAGLALGGEWRVWRFVTDFIAHLYGWSAVCWLAWRLIASSGIPRRVTPTGSAVPPRPAINA
jgi:hypothetical protein